MGAMSYTRSLNFVPEADSLWSMFAADRDNFELRERLIVAYLPLVKQVMRTIVNRLPVQLDHDDLESQGVLGLIDAVSRFDPSRGVQFQTYASLRIRGHILDSLREMDTLPRTARRRAREIQDALSALWVKLSRAPTDEETAAQVGLSMAEYRGAIADASLAIVSLDDPLARFEEDSVVLGDLVADDTQTSDERMMEADLRKQLLDAVASLPEREKQIIALYYYEELTLKEIGRVLGVTESRACQMHGKAVLTLRAFLAAKEIAS